MIHSETYNFVYYAPKKTGSTTMVHILKSQYGGRTAFAKHRMVKTEEFDNYFKFATIRNPYARIISFFNAKIVKAKHYTLNHAISGCYRIADLFNSKGIKIDKYIHLENLEEEFLTLPFAKPSTTFFKKNVSFKYLIGLTETYREMIATKYAEDFIAGGYDPNICPVPIFKTFEECLDPNLTTKVEQQRGWREKRWVRKADKKERRKQWKATKLKLVAVTL